MERAGLRYLTSIYVGLWMMYYWQEMLMLRGLAAQMIFIVLMFISFYTIYALHVNYRLCPYIKWLDIMMVILTIYGIIPIIGGWTLFNKEFKIVETWISYIYLQRIYISILPIYSFYYFSLRGVFSNRQTNFLFASFLILCILMFYQNYFSISAKLQQEEITNNSGYFFIPLISMLQLLKIKDVWKYLCLVIISVYVILSMKRGAIMAGSVMLLCYMVRVVRNVPAKRMIYVVTLSLAVSIIIYVFVAEQFAENYYFQKRVEQTLSGDSSGRGWIYENYWDYFVWRTSPLEFLIGNGANATRVLLGYYAHNDWLEFAIDFGVLGVMLYIIYWLVFVWEWVQYRGPVECKWVLFDMIISYFLISLYSMSFDGMPIGAAFCIGYCLAQNEIARNEQLMNRVKQLIRR